MFVLEKLKHFGNSLNSFRNELDPKKNAWGGKWTSRIRRETTRIFQKVEFDRPGVRSP